MAKTKWAVDILESERGWGQRIDSTAEFDDYDEALQFQKDFNKDNNKVPVPDWYMKALDPRPMKNDS